MLYATIHLTTKVMSVLVYNYKKLILLLIFVQKCGNIDIDNF